MVEVSGDDDFGFLRIISSWLTQAAQNVDAVHGREHDVEQNDVVGIGLGLGEGLLTVAY